MKWNVDPVLIHIGSFPLKYYGLLMVLGIAVSGQLIAKFFKSQGKDPEAIYPLTTFIICGMMIGARLVHCVFYEPQYYMMNPMDVFKVWQGGLASHGGYLGVILAVYLFSRTQKTMSFLFVMDVLAAPALFCGGLVRIGNLFNSEILGNPTDVPWAVIFERVDEIPRHPVMVYEALGYFAIGGVLFMMLLKRFEKWPRGLIFLWGIVLSFTFRFFVEFFKQDQESNQYSSILSMGQILSLVFVIFGVLGLLRNRRSIRSK